MSQRKHKAALGFIFVTLLIDVIGIGIIIPVIPTLLEGMIDGGLSEASRIGGWLMLSYSAMQFIFSPIVGSLSDKVGRRPVILISLFGLGLDYIFFAFAPTVAWLFVGRLLAGAAGASFTTATAYIADISTPEKRAQNFGLIGAAFGLGFIIGPLLGGVFAQWGVRVPFLIASGLTLLNMIYGFFILPESLPKENRRKFDIKRANPAGALIHLRKYPIIAGLIASFFLLYIAGHSVQSTWTYFTMLRFEWDEAMVGYSLAYVGILVALIQGGLIRFIIPKLGHERAIYAGLALNFLGLLLFSFASTNLMLYLFTIPYCLGGIAGPALQGIVSNQVPANEQGELQGAMTSIVSITSIIGPVLMTQVFGHFTGDSADFFFPGAPFALAAFLSLLGIFSAIRTFRKVRPLLVKD